MAPILKGFRVDSRKTRQSEASLKPEYAETGMRLWRTLESSGELTNPGQYGGICFQEPGFGVRITSSGCRYGLVLVDPEGRKGEGIRTAGNPLQ